MLYLLGPVGGSKSSLAERAKSLVEVLANSTSRQNQTLNHRVERVAGR
ncbi:hypothetical protein [Bradyrhizobium sp. LA6.1]